jgi:hypothetical protein
MVFNLQTALAYLPRETSHIRNALDGWKLAWNARSESTQDPSQAEGWRRDGFIRHADEFRLLALISLERAMQGGREKPQDESVPHDSRSTLGRYDETSMRQVTDLMEAFQSLRTT